MEIDSRLIELAAKCTTYRAKMALYELWTKRAIENRDWLSAAQCETKLEVYTDILNDIESILLKESKIYTTVS